MRSKVRGFFILLGAILAIAPQASADEPLYAGLAAVDITPTVAKGAKPVWLAGYGPGRQATGIHDPLYARAVVLRHGETKFALVSVDLVGLQHPALLAIRKRLPDYAHVTVASTHSHEGPDVVGIWGKTPFHRGVDEEYIAKVISAVVEAIASAEKAAQAVTVKFGQAHDETLVNDSRLPKAKDDKLAVLQFNSVETGKPIGLLTAWSCHPEAMGSKNTLLTADFPAATVAALEKHYACPVAYFSTAVGGLMGPPRGRIFDDKKVELKEGDWEYARRLGEEVAQLAIKAVDAAEPCSLTPLAAAVEPIYMPVDNRLYRLARVAGVLKRDGYIWMNDYRVKGEPAKTDPAMDMAIESEVGCLRLGDVYFPLIPGEIYPELVYGQYQEPVEPNVDYPDAPLETPVTKLLPRPKWILLGLANDELGYLLPKRQWDFDSPFAYGRKSAQYGEINSCGCDAGPIVMQALDACVKKLLISPQSHEGTKQDTEK